MKRALLFIVLLLTVATAVAHKQARHYVRPGDTVNINCDEETALNKQYTVSKDGFVVMQYVGAVQIAGLTEEGAATKIGQALVAERILPKASVGVQVAATPQGVISFSGAVANSGQANPKRGMRLSDVVELAEPTAQANLQRVRIVTAASNEFVANYAAYNGHDEVNNPEVLSGDSVFFDSTAPQVPIQPVVRPAQQPQQAQPQQPAYQPMQQPSMRPDREQHYQTEGFVTVHGAVENPTRVPFHDGMTITIAIANAGGFLKDSDGNSVRLDEKRDGQVRTSNVNVNDIQKGFAGDRVLLQGDVIEVPYKHHGHNNALKIAGLVLLGIILIH